MAKRSSPRPGHPLRRDLGLRDCLRIIRRYRGLILVIALIGGGASLLRALLQDQTYQAQTSIAFRVEGQDLDVFGVSPAASQQAAELAVINADTATRPEVVGRVRRALGTSRSVEDLTSIVDAVPTAGSLVITARDTDARFATRLADGIAREVVRIHNGKARARFGLILRAARWQIRLLRSRVPRSGQAYLAQQIAGLRSLSSFANTVEIPEPAPATVAPVSRQPVRSTAAGLAFGLLAGLLTAFLAQALDRRLGNQLDVQAHFELPVLATLTPQSLGEVIPVAGQPRRAWAADLEQLRRLKGHLEFLDPDRPVRSILVTSALPEEGKSTVAASLALVMGAAGRRTLLVECDLRRPVLAARLGIDARPGLTDLMAGEAGLEGVLRRLDVDGPASPGAWGNGEQGGDRLSQDVAFIPAGTPTSSAAELLGSGRFEDLLTELSRDYDAVVLDSSPLLPVADTLALVPRADAVLVCVRVLQTTSNQALAAKAVLEHFPRRPMGLVVVGGATAAEPARPRLVRAPATPALRRV